MAAKHRHDTGTTGRTARRRWRVPALLSAAALTGTALTFGLAAAPASAGTNVDVKLGGTGPLSSVCKTITGKVFATPGSAVSVVTSTTGLKLPTVTNLLSSLDLANTKTIVKNSKGQVVGTATKGKSVKLPASTATYTYTNALDVKVGLPPVIPTKTITVPLLAVPGVSSAKATQTLSLVVKPDINGCGVEIKASVPVKLPIPSVSVSIPGVGGVSVGSGGGSGAASGSSAPSTGMTTPGTTKTAPKPGAKTSTTTTNPYDYTAPDCTGPCAVVPKGGSSGGRVGGASDVTLGDLGDVAAPGSAAGAGSSGGSGSPDADGAAIAAAGNPGGAGSDQIAVDRAFADAGKGGTTVPGLPMSLTIAAIAALAGASVLWFARRRLARG